MPARDGRPAPRQRLSPDLDRGWIDAPRSFLIADWTYDVNAFRSAIAAETIAANQRNLHSNMVG